MQDPSFLAFQRRMQDSEARSNCQSLFSIQRIPSDNCIRSLLDGCPSGLRRALPHLPRHPRRQRRPRSLPAPRQQAPHRLDGIEFSKSYKIKCDHCSTRHVGKAKTPQYFHSMVCPAVVADGHNRVISLMPEFVKPRHDPAAHDTELTGQRQKQDCERNAAKRWISKHASNLAAYRPVLLGDDIYCCHPICQLVRDSGADFLFVCKPDSHKCLHDFLHPALYHSTGWLRRRNARRHIEFHRCRWQTGVPVRDGADAVSGTWIEFTVRRKAPDGKGWQQTYRNTFFTSLKVTPANVAAIARAGRARWMIENETFNCLSRQGYHLKHNFGHGSDGLANLLAVINLLAFTFHSVLDSLQGLWRQLRDLLVTRRDFFENLRVAGDWTAAGDASSGRRPPSPAGRPVPERPLALVSCSLGLQQIAFPSHAASTSPRPHHPEPSRPRQARAAARLGPAHPAAGIHHLLRPAPHPASDRRHPAHRGAVPPAEPQRAGAHHLRASALADPQGPQPQPAGVAPAAPAGTALHPHPAS